MEGLVGVIAGTPVDTKMGVDFLSDKDIWLRDILFQNAKEQSRFQLLSKENLYKEVVKLLKRLNLME